uniref:Uncharacterized protein n=1 Tax=Aegilops tauschii subsp. strangulata TaxID=200361 RepID=A0A453CVC7_AEGTS
MRLYFGCNFFSEVLLTFSESQKFHLHPAAPLPTYLFTN